MDAPSQPLLVRFATFEVDLRAGELRKAGSKIRLQEKPFRVLATLLERPGEVVSREDLRAILWPADTFVDFDNSLNNAVNRLRAALGDSADNPRFVETVGRRGYRFIFPVDSPVPVAAEPPKAARLESPEPVPVESLDTTAAEQPAGAGRTLRGRVFVTLAVVALVVVSFLVAALVQRGGSVSGQAFRSIAVLPLANHSGDPGQDYFADGMTEALIAELARVRSLRVISRTSVMQYRDTTKTLTRIAEELRVDAVVEGSVLRTGDRVRVTAQLVDGSTDSHIWAETYHRDVRDVLSLQKDVAEAIARAVRAELTSSEERQLTATRSVDPQALDLYLRGRSACTMRQPPEEAKKGLELIRQAIVRDPKYAQAHAALASCYAVLGTILVGQPPALTRPHAAAAASAAIALDDGLAEAHAALAALDMRDWKWDRAGEGFRRAIALAPNDAATRSEHAMYLAVQGRLDEAMSEARQAEGLDPLSLHRRTEVGFILQLARRHDESLRQFQSVLETDPNFLFARWLIGITYALKGLYSEAVDCFATAEKLSASPSMIGWRAYALAMAGQRTDAQALLDGLLQRVDREYVPPASVAVAFMALGDRDRTFEWLERAYAERSNLMLFLGVYQLVDPLRSDPRFVDLLRRVGLPAGPRSSSRADSPSGALREAWFPGSVSSAAAYAVNPCWRR